MIKKLENIKGTNYKLPEFVEERKNKIHEILLALDAYIEKTKQSNYPRQVKHIIKKETKDKTPSVILVNFWIDKTNKILLAQARISLNLY